MTDEIKTNETKTDAKTDANIELDAIRKKYETEIADRDKAIKERDEKITKLQTYIADHLTQPDNGVTTHGNEPKTFNDKYRDLVKSLDKKA